MAARECEICGETSQSAGRILVFITLENPREYGFGGRGPMLVCQECVGYVTEPAV